LLTLGLYQRLALLLLLLLLGQDLTHGLTLLLLLRQDMT
jgi:hypothetical protein